ncbi:MAG: hypothetical protein LBH93_00540 [Chitinispirillales bacterium]|nr:hypothetical protein [Chitinispirillales bacterium]
MNKVQLSLLTAIFIAMAFAPPSYGENAKKPKTVMMLDIEGRHTYSDGCKIALDVQSRKDGYVYRLQVNSQMYRGNVIVHDGSIELEGIPIKQYEYKLVNGERTNVESAPDYGLWFDVEDGRLSFQNRGNPMAYFVVFDDCGDKFVTLAKEAPGSKGQ